jgi:hypothetical protein
MIIIVYARLHIFKHAFIIQASYKVSFDKLKFYGIYITCYMHNNCNNNNNVYIFILFKYKASLYFLVFIIKYF